MKSKIKFCSEDFRKARDDYKAKWAALDSVLYDLCNRFPDHKDPGGVRAKLWTIGRTYATGIERQIISNGSQGNSMEKLAEHFVAKADDLDSVLNILKSVHEPISSEHIGQILAAHYELCGLIRPILRTKGRSPRSFASKYLHFHCPAVPIYDSVSVSRLRMFDRAVAREGFLGSRDVDEPYQDFVSAFWRLYQVARGESGNAVTVRHLDWYLINTKKT